MGNRRRRWLSICCVAVLALSGAACKDKEVVSAYDIAVKNGYTGTESEWLLSLHGKDGEDGEDLDALKLYQAAQELGYEGTYLEFCKELNIATPSAPVTLARNLTSVVSVVCDFTTTKSSWAGRVEEHGSQAGSGVIVEFDGEAGNAYIVTNYHVVYNYDSDQKGISNNVWIYPYGSLNGYDTSIGKDEIGDGIKATYVGGAMQYDIALLKIENSEDLKANKESISAATLGDSDEVTVGETTYAIGNPAGKGIAVTSGILSVDSEKLPMNALDNQGGTIDYRVMRTSAPINGGNSGGGLFNAQGELIGIVNAKLVWMPQASENETAVPAEGIGYALPITQVKAVYENILDNGREVKRATLGVDVSLTGSKAVYEGGKLVVREEFCVSGAPASSANAAYEKLHKNDAFLSARIERNGATVVEKTFTRLYQLTDFLLQIRKGDTARFKVNKNGAEVDVEIPFTQDSHFTVYG